MGFYPDNRIFLVVELRGPLEDFEGDRGFLDFVLPAEENHVAQVLQEPDTAPRLRKQARMTNRLNFVPNLSDRGGLRDTLLH
jgi:hypothetical protein